MSNEAFVHMSAEVAPSANLQKGVRVWSGCRIRDGVSVGENSSIGSGAYIGSGVSVGANCKIQNSALLYEPAKIHDGVFIGPNVTLLNDHNPRAVLPDGTQKTLSDWDSVGVEIEHGASIGAGAICIAPLRIGAWAMVGAGSVVTRDVVPHSLVRGNPARHVGWVGKLGFALLSEDEFLVCPKSGTKYREVQGTIIETGGR